MASAPPQFGASVPQVGRLPIPGNTNAGITEGADAIAQATARAAATTRETDSQVRESRLQTSNIVRERQVQLQTGDTAARLAELQGQLNVDLIGMRQQAAPGATGYEDQVNDRIGRFRDDATALLGNDPEMVGRFVDNIATIGANARTEEVKWAATQRAAKSVTDGDTLQSAMQSNIRTAVAGGTYSPAMLADADRLDQRYVDAQPLTPEKKTEWLSQRHDGRLVTAIEALTDRDPHSVMADIDKGTYGELEDKTVQVLRERARVMADHLDTQARQATNEQSGTDRARAETEIEDVTAGVLKDPNVLANYRAEFAGSTKPEDIKIVHSLDTAIARNATTAKFDTSTQDERHAAIAAIETHQGWDHDQAMVAAHTQLQALISRDDAAADKDPLGLYQRQTGQDIGRLDLHDPAAMNARFIAADRAAARYGKAVASPFTAPEADQLKQQYNQATAAGKADFILGLGAYGSARARQMMFQIAPTNPALVRLAELSAAPDAAVKSIVREASDGAAAPVKEGVAAGVRNVAQRDFGAALSGMPGDRQAAVLQVASWVYAHRATASGKANVLDPALAHDAIQAALGGTGSKGGIGNRNGSPVVLPMGATQDDFDRVLALGAGHPDAVRQASNGVPKWLNGSDMTTRQFLDLVPVQIADTGTQTLYSFKSRGGSGTVKNERGQDYVVDIRRLSAALDHSSRFNAVRK